MRRDLLLLWEMIDAAEQAQWLVEDRSVIDIEADRLRREALLWNFTVLGEAAGLISEETRTRFGDVPWRNPTRLRNRVVHGYWSVDFGVLHTTATEQLGDFVSALRNVARALEDEASGNDGEPN
ncbi:MAG: HepT-like ribonuclease domain-containing protein [Pseudonocardia sp.]